MVGNDSASKVYVRNKSIACEEVGIEYEEYLLDDNTTMEELLELINKLNKDESMSKRRRKLVSQPSLLKKVMEWFKVSSCHSVYGMINTRSESFGKIDISKYKDNCN